jgi:alkaline phosphatase
LVNAPLDVLLGGGMQYFAQRGFGGEEQPLAHAKARGWWLATNSAELAAAPLDKPLLGLFADKNLPVALIGARQRKAESVADKPKLAAEVFSCIDNPDAASAPSLQVMTEKALATLGRDRQRGFFLMIESASIDKQSHSRQPCGHIGELEQLEQALRSALAFATERPNTLILVTADHGHAAQIIPEQDQLDAGYATAHSPGAVARVRTPEGSIMMVNYATSTSDYEMHTGTNVPLYASGPGSDELPSYLTQVDVYRLMQQFLGL